MMATWRPFGGFALDEAKVGDAEPGDNDKLAEGQTRVVMALSMDVIRDYFAQTGYVLSTEIRRVIDLGALAVTDRRRLAIALNPELRRKIVLMVPALEGTVSFSPFDIFTGRAMETSTELRRTSKMWQAPFAPDSDFKPEQWAELLAAFERDYMDAEEYVLSATGVSAKRDRR